MRIVYNGRVANKLKGKTNNKNMQKNAHLPTKNT